MFPVPVGGVLKVEIVRGHDSAVFAFGNEQRIEQGAGHERALSRPRGLSGLEHILDALHKISEVHEWAHFLCPEHCRFAGIVSGFPCYGPFADSTVEREHGHF